jgi:hypothetical protein
MLFAAIVELLHAWWVYEKGVSLAVGDRNQFVDIWLQISLYSYEILPIAIVLQ